MSEFESPFDEFPMSFKYESSVLVHTFHEAFKRLSGLMICKGYWFYGDRTPSVEKRCETTMDFRSYCPLITITYNDELYFAPREWFDEDKLNKVTATDILNELYWRLIGEK